MAWIASSMVLGEESRDSARGHCETGSNGTVARNPSHCSGTRSPPNAPESSAMTVQLPGDNSTANQSSPTFVSVRATSSAPFLNTASRDVFRAIPLASRALTNTLHLLLISMSTQSVPGLTITGSEKYLSRCASSSQGPGPGRVTLNSPDMSDIAILFRASNSTPLRVASTTVSGSGDPALSMTRPSTVCASSIVTTTDLGWSDTRTSS
jgi:hypothetical protein